ncbi:MAG: hypothetical protein A2255_06955 [Candidatus Melainabacteria bacterium RIFOXYA2_FULL_32_9]|nr:MAG: hypothetical protein A2255_06955 [Candidatus Melainabacteria bacterium RIFOXYA2_FULL_32_9]
MIINRLKFSLLMIFACIFFSSLTCYAEANKYDAVCKKYGFTIEEEQEIGFQAALTLIRKYDYYKNPLVNQYVSNVGETIAKNISQRPDIKYRFVVLNSNEVNAFSTPGGFVLITKGTLSVLDNEAELAAVLSHEISHVEEGHGLQAIASDPNIKEKLKQIKTIVTTNENKMDILDKELRKNQGGSTLVNFENAINADNCSKHKLF